MMREMRLGAAVMGVVLAVMGSAEQARRWKISPHFSSALVGFTAAQV